MAITFNETEAAFIGECRVADADALYEWLQKHPEGKVRMGQCSHFHAALLQVLMVVKANIIEPPTNPLLRRWIFGLGEEVISPWTDAPIPLLQIWQENLVEEKPLPMAPATPVRTPATSNTRTRRRPTTATLSSKKAEQ